MALGIRDPKRNGGRCGAIGRITAKKKMSKINRHAKGTGGGPALPSSLTDLESRVMQIIGVQAAIGMPVEEVGFTQEAGFTQPDEVPIFAVIEEINPSTGPATSPGQPEPSISGEPLQEEEEIWQPPQKKRKINEVLLLFIDSDKRSRDLEVDRLRQRDEELRLRGEELRLREEEMRERVRQRDIELKLQEKWLDVMREGMNAFVKLMEKQVKDE